MGYFLCYFSDSFIGNPAAEKIRKPAVFAVKQIEHKVRRPLVSAFWHPQENIFEAVYLTVNPQIAFIEFFLGHMFRSENDMGRIIKG